MSFFQNVATKKLAPLLVGYFLLSSCTGSSTADVDSLFDAGGISLTQISDQIVAQTDTLTIDVNNISDGSPGTDNKMSYSCVWDNTVDRDVADNAAKCETMDNVTATFDGSNGILKLTAGATILGNREIKIIGVGPQGRASQTFSVGFRLKFLGITNITAITGTSVTMVWTPNTNAASYQVSKLNTTTGNYEIIKTVTGSSSSGTTVTGLTPNTPYTMRVQAFDNLGNSDGNVVSRTFTTTELIRFGLSPLTVTSAAGTPVSITVQAYNADGSPQTVGGVVISPQIATGTTTGSFSSVTDNNDGTYSFTFTPNIIGTPAEIDVTTNMTFFIQSTTTVTATPGPVSNTNSTLVLSANSVTSNQAVTVTATMRDQYNNPVDAGTVTFSKSAGTSTFTSSATAENTPGVYSATLTGVVAGTAAVVRATINSVMITPSQNLTVIPGLPVVANSTLTISSGTVASSSLVNLTATLRDINNNPVPSGISVVFTKSGGTSTGVLDSTTNAGAGVYTNTYTGQVAGSAQTISLTIDGAPLALTTTIAVVPGTVSVANSVLTTSSPTITSSQFANITATLRDSFNNPITSGIVVTFNKSGGTATGTFNAVTNQGGGEYLVRYTGVVAGTAQTIQVVVDGTPIALTTTVAVTPGAPSITNSTLSVAAPTVASGAAVTVTATIRDSNNNPIPSGILVAFTKTGGTSTGTYGSVTNAGGGVYTIDYTGVVAGTNQTLGVNVDSNPMGLTANISVVPGLPNSTLSTITTSSATVVAGSNVLLTFTLRDSQSNLISAGHVITFGASGGTSTGTFGAVTNQGDGTYTVQFTGHVSGTAKTIQASVDAAPFGATTNVQVLTGTPHAGNSSIAASPSPVASGASSTITATVRDSENNPIVADITFDAISGSSTGVVSGASYIGGGQWQATYTGVISGSAQTLRVLYLLTPVAGVTTTLQVVPGAVSLANSSFTSTSTTVQSGTSATLSVQLRDAENNRIAGRTVTFNKNSTANSDGNISVITESPASSGNYSATYTATQQGSAQTLQVVVDGSPVGGLTQNLTVTAGPPSQMQVTRSVSATNPMNSTQCVGPLTVTLKDAANNSTSSLTPITVSISSGAWKTAFYHTGTLFSDAGCSSTLTQLDFPAGVSAQSFYYKNFTPITYSLTLDAPASITDQVISMQTQPMITFVGAVAQAGMSHSNLIPVASELTSSTAAGPVDALEMHLDGSTLYVADRGSYRILRYDLSTNPYTFSGWVGVIGHKENLSAPCNGQSLGAYTSTWCTGGRAIVGNNFDTLYGMTSDSTYLYVALNNRIERIFKSNGQRDGWIGYINTAGVVCTGGTSSANFPTPGWCPVGNVGNAAANANPGSLSTPVDITILGGYLFISDNGNHRIQRWTTAGVYSGWFGRINASPSATPTAPLPAQAAGCSGATNLTTNWCIDGTAQSLNRQVGNVGATLTTEGFNGPMYLQNDGTNIYFSDWGNNRLIRLNPTTLAMDFIGRIGNSLNNPSSPVQTDGAHTNGWSTAGYSSGDTAGPSGYGERWYGFFIDSGKFYAANLWHAIFRLDLADGQNGRWIERVSSTPTGGAVGCSTAPVMGHTPGWCSGGAWNRASISNSGFLEVRSVVVYDNSGTKEVLALDRYNHRIQRFNATTGAFIGYMGFANVAVNQWTTTSPSGSQYFASRGYSENSFFNNDIVSSITGIGDDFYVNDMRSGRLRRFNQRFGQSNGWSGTFDWTNGTLPNAPDACLGITSGATPGFCTGGYRQQNSATAQGNNYNNPTAIVTDGTYYYVGHASSNRVDKYLVADNGYVGWTGRVNTTPTDGEAGCVGLSNPSPTNRWCIGGAPLGSNSFAGFNGGIFGMFYDSDSGYVFVTDQSRLHRLNPSTGVIDAVIGHIAAAGAVGCTITSNTPSGWCTAGNAAGGGTDAFGGLQEPYGVWADATYLYVADNHTVRRYNKSTGAPTGIVGRMNAATGFNVSGDCAGSTFPGALKGWCSGTGVGVALGAHSTGTGDGEFNALKSITGDANYLYLADSNNHRIVRINKTTGAFAGWKGVIDTTTNMTGACLAAGADAKTPGDTWCMGGTAKRSSLLGGFDTPTGVSSDENYIYVADTRNNRIVTLPK